MNSTPKYAKVALKISETDNSAFGVVNAARKALQKAGAPPAEIETFSKEALSGDYNHVLNTTAHWVGFKH
ncbi:hypothetical protein [Belnapia rosea]|uniref:hypothetical protein n=1 Tax=Belnapia rosea TaxID=938405 RepID=UPI00088B6686|nr:hypothetical protein [Belnapia rosea]SDB22443.1 hypothetical protein SAMN02927895_00896 [Belnapia rosea]